MYYNHLRGNNMKGTKKTKKKESLHKGEICLHDIIEKSVDGMVILDKGGIVCFVNPAAEAFFDKNAKTLLGKEFSYPVKEGKTTEIDVVRKDGKIRIGEILISGTVWEGKPALLASIRDITERKQLERLKDEFIGTVSHELRTPMTTIREAISQVLDGILGGINEKQKEFLSICLENVDRLKRIVDNLLEVAMLKAGAAEIRRDVVRCQDLIITFYYSFVEIGVFNETAVYKKELFTISLSGIFRFSDKTTNLNK